MRLGSGAPCTRPYDLGKRNAQMRKTREQVLLAARASLESGGVRDLTMDSLAKASGVTRQTVHNLFRTRSGVLEALFDQIAVEAGMERVREVMSLPNAGRMLSAFVETFIGFWTRDRLLLRRIHGIAAIDPEFAQAIQARNQRRQMAAARLIEHLGPSGLSVEEKAQRVATLIALTSFEFFDALAESMNDVTAAGSLLLGIVSKALDL